MDARCLFIGQTLTILLQYVADAFQGELDFFQRRVDRNLNICLSADVFATAQVLNLRFRHHVIGNRNQATVEGTNLG